MLGVPHLPRCFKFLFTTIPVDPVGVETTVGHNKQGKGPKRKEKTEEESQQSARGLSGVRLMGVENISSRDVEQHDMGNA